jgi:uncharacterized protein YajQ (UPF0234 family)
MRRPRAAQGHGRVNGPSRATPPRRRCRVLAGKPSGYARSPVERATSFKGADGITVHRSRQSLRRLTRISALPRCGHAMPSFDVVSKLDEHELTNAIDQANRELTKRFDFKGSNAEFELSDGVVTMKADAEFRLKQMQDILMQRLAARGIDVRCAKFEDPEVNLATARQKVTLRQGIEQALAKKIVKLIKDSGSKVQAQIQGDQLRIVGKKRDELQETIALLRKSDLEMPLQYENFRD